MMKAFRLLGLAVAITVAVTSSRVHAQASTSDSIVPLEPIRTETGGLEVVSGDPTKAGMPYVIRLQTDRGYIVLPHTHPEDENIVVVKGTWSLAMGDQVDRSSLEPMDIGAYALVPDGAAHYGRSETEVVLQIHGTGPFSTDFTDPVYNLSEEGVSLVRTAGTPGESVTSVPSDCFEFRMGDQIRGAPGRGTVVGALCSPSNRFTQYWVETNTGARFWATGEEIHGRRSQAPDR